MQLVDDNNYSNLVEQNENPVLLVLGTRDDPNCKAMGPVLAQTDGTLPEKTFLAVTELSQSPGIAEKWGIDINAKQQLPIFVLLHHNRIDAVFRGIRPIGRLQEDVRTYLVPQK